MWVFTDTIPIISSKSLTKDTNFANLILIVGAYSIITKLYGMENIATEEVMDKIYIFQASLRKVENICLWDTEIIQTNAGKNFNSIKQLTDS